MERNQQTCEVLCWHWRTARRRHQNPIKALRGFAGAILHPARAQIGPLRGLGLLDPKARAAIENRIEGLHLDIAEVLEEGARAGQVRPGDPLMTARVVLGLLLWTPRAFRHLQASRSRISPSRAQEAIQDLISYGWAGNRSLDFETASLDAADFSVAFPRHVTSPADQPVDRRLIIASALFNRISDGGGDEEDIRALRAQASALCGSCDAIPVLARRCHSRTVGLFLQLQKQVLSADQPAGVSALGFLKAAAGGYLGDAACLISPFAGLEELEPVERACVDAEWAAFGAVLRTCQVNAAVAGHLRNRYHDAAPVFGLALFGLLASGQIAAAEHEVDRVSAEIARLFWLGLAPMPTPESLV